MLNQGAGCPTNVAPCQTVQSPSIRFGQPVPTNCASIAAPFPYQQCIDTSVNPAILKEFIGSAWYPVATLSPSAGYLPLFSSVPSNAVLTSRSTANYPLGVWRTDYAVGNGAEPMLYLPSTSACTVNAGAGDNGSQVRSSDGKCWIAQPPEIGYDIREFGARGNCSTDDSAALQAAALTGVPVRLGNGHFLINSGVALTTPIQLIGSGFAMQGIVNGVCGTDEGSFLVTTQTTVAPITLNGAGPSGSQFKNFAVVETQPVATGGWTPTVYQPFFLLNGASAPLTDVTFDGIGAGAIYQLISGIGNAARLRVDNITGQVFNNVLFVDDALDTSSAHNWHIWPYWSSDSNVMNWQTTHSLPFRFLRQDGFQADNIFILGAKACIDLSANTTGVIGPPSGIQFGSVWCDVARNAVWIEAPATQASITIAHLRGGGEALTGGPIPGGNTILIDGQAATVEIGDLLDFERAQSVLNISNNGVGSIVNFNTIQVQDSTFNYSGNTPCAGTSPLFYVAPISGNQFASMINVSHYIQPEGCGYNSFVGNSIETSGLINTDASADLRVGAGQNWVFEQISDGGTLNLPLWAQDIYYYAPATQAAVTWVLPSPGGVDDGKTINVFCGVAVTALTVTPNTGQAIIGGGPTSCALGQLLTFKFNAIQANWWASGGTASGGGGGGGGVNPGTAGQFAYYATTGSMVSALAPMTYTSSTHLITHAETAAGGTVTTETLNGSSANNSVAGFNAVTGGVNTYLSLQEGEFTGSPASLITSGAGNTSGLAIQTLAGGITINPATTVRIPTLAPSSAVCTDASSNLISGSCGSGGGGVVSGAAGQIGYYAATGSTISGLPALTYTAGVLTLGSALPGATLSSVVSNSSAANNSVAGVNIVTGGTNTYVSIQESQFTGSPAGLIDSGVGNTGGLAIQTRTGGITLNPATTVRIPTLTPSSPVCTDGASNLISGSCGGGGGGVGPGTAGQLAYYASTGTTVTGLAPLTYTSGQLLFSSTVAAGTVVSEIQNASAANNSVAGLTAATGGANTYFALQQLQAFGSPAGLLTTGTGDSGGMGIQSLAGAITLTPATIISLNGPVNLPALAASSTLCTDSSKNITTSGCVGGGGGMTTNGANATSAALGNLAANNGSATVTFGGSIGVIGNASLGTLGVTGATTIGGSLVIISEGLAVANTYEGPGTVDATTYWARAQQGFTGVGSASCTFVGGIAVSC